jgi:uncharacterized membrane protein
MKTFKFLSRHGLIVATFLVLAAFQAGCVSITDTTAPGVALYLRGELQVNIDRRFEVVVRAANKAVTELQFSKIEEKKDALVAIITARTADDIKINIRVEKQTDSLTTVRIRAGTIGNEKLSFAVYNKIKELL